MAVPSFRAAGTAVFTANSVANPTSLTPTKNVATVNGDLMVLITESRNITATVGTPSGWNIVSGFPKASATASGGKIYAFTRIADSTANDAPTVTWTGLTTGTTGDSAGARILSFQNGTETADGTPPAANDAASTTSITIPAHVTALAQSLVVGVAMRVNDTLHTFTTATFTERSDDHTTTGTGHGTTVASKINAAAGSSGTATVTPSNTTSSRTLAVSFGLKAAPTNVAVNQTTETATAQAVTRQKIKAAAQVTETDTAQALTRQKARAAAQVSETNSAQAITTQRVRAISQATETDAAQAITRGTNNQTVAVAQATETGSAQTLTARKTLAVSQSSETDAAHTVSASKARAVALATESDTAQSVGRQKTRTAAQATETDAAQLIAARKYAAVGLAVETSTAQPAGTADRGAGNGERQRSGAGGHGREAVRCGAGRRN